jgi:DNA-binding transcriptional ArsR family regulator
MNLPGLNASPLPSREAGRPPSCRWRRRVRHAFEALGSPARARNVRLLIRKNARIGTDIVDELPLAQSTDSQHRKVLKDAGLIRGDVDGARVCYCIEPHGLRRLRALVGGADAGRTTLHASFVADYP